MSYAFMILMALAAGVYAGLTFGIRAGCVGFVLGATLALLIVTFIRRRREARRVDRR